MNGASVNSENAAEPTAAWSGTRRFWVSVILIWHLLAIFVAPWAAVEPRSQLSLSLRRVFEPYLQFMYLDHGYRFFAPEPGPSHIVQYELIDSAGQTTRHQFPDRDSIWPRLRYHRWFMLSESINQFASQILDDESKKRWKADVDEQAQRFEQEGNLRRAADVRRDYERQLANYRQVLFLFDHISQDVGRVLLKQHGAKAVSMKLVTRVIPTPYDVLDGFQLADDVFLPKDLQTDMGIVGQGREQLPLGQEDEP